MDIEEGGNTLQALSHISVLMALLRQEKLQPFWNDVLGKTNNYAIMGYVKDKKIKNLAEVIEKDIEVLELPESLKGAMENLITPVVNEICNRLVIFWSLGARKDFSIVDHFVWTRKATVNEHETVRKLLQKELFDCRTHLVSFKIAMKFGLEDMKKDWIVAGKFKYLQQFEKQDLILSLMIANDYKSVELILSNVSAAEKKMFFSPYIRGAVATHDFGSIYKMLKRRNQVDLYFKFMKSDYGKQLIKEKQQELDARLQDRCREMMVEMLSWTSL